MSNPTMTLTGSQLKRWLRAYLAQLLGVTDAEVDPAFSFELYGLDSTAAVGLSGDLSDLLGREFETGLAYDYPSIDALVDHLVSSRVVAPG